MKDKIKEKIENLKKDKICMKEYIKSFCEIKKCDELFVRNPEYKILKDSIMTKKSIDYFD